jgi:hypothetical protein
LSIRIHRSLRRKTKTQIEALHIRTNSLHHPIRYKACTLSTAKAAQPHMQNNKHKTKENRYKRASPIFISTAGSTGFPIQQQQCQSIQF